MAANFVINNGPRLVLERVAGLTELGYFTLGAQLALPMDLAVSAFTTAWYPFFMSFQTKQNEASPVFGRVLRLYIWGFGLVALLGFAFARAGVMLIAARDYEPAYLVIGLIATARVLWGVYNIVVPGLYFAGKLRYITVLQSMAAVVAIGVTFAVARVSPLLGCVLGIVSGNLALVLLQVAWNARQGQRIVSAGQARAGVFTLIFCVFAVVSLLPRKFGIVEEFGTAAGGALLLVTLVFAVMPRKERGDLMTFVTTRLRKLRTVA
jgi:O-antigen/teichoic acid export membrane protein